MTGKPLPTFDEGLREVLAKHRRDDTLDDARLTMIVIGYLHDYVQRLDVRGAAMVALMSCDVALERRTPDEIFEILKADDLLREKAKQCIAAVVNSIMRVPS